MILQVSSFGIGCRECFIFYTFTILTSYLGQHLAQVIVRQHHMSNLQVAIHCFTRGGDAGGVRQQVASCFSKGFCSSLLHAYLASV
jgi:hypothetical protein